MKSEIFTLSSSLFLSIPYVVKLIRKLKYNRTTIVYLREYLIPYYSYLKILILLKSILLILLNLPQFPIFNLHCKLLGKVNDIEPLMIGCEMQHHGFSDEKPTCYSYTVYSKACIRYVMKERLKF